MIYRAASPHSAISSKLLTGIVGTDSIRTHAPSELGPKPATHCSPLIPRKGDFHQRGSGR
jgi:hypothetical protein